MGIEELKKEVKKLKEAEAKIKQARSYVAMGKNNTSKGLLGVVLFLFIAIFLLMNLFIFSYLNQEKEPLTIIKHYYSDKTIERIIEKPVYAFNQTDWICVGTINERNCKRTPGFINKEETKKGVA